MDIKQFRNILIPRLDTFGDIVLLQGFIAAVLDYLPEAQITVLVRKGYEQLVPMFPQRLIWKTTPITLDKRPTDIKEITSFLKDMADNSYDLLLTTTFNRTWLDDLLATVMLSSMRIALDALFKQMAFNLFRGSKIILAT